MEPLSRDVRALSRRCVGVFMMHPGPGVYWRERGRVGGDSESKVHVCLEDLNVFLVV